jgi:nucleotide-binding universal stress UspA family protein
MTALLNIQIVPFCGSAPNGAKIVLLPAREDEGEESTCANCEGRGKLPRGEQCGRCHGAGRARFIHAMRWEGAAAPEEIQAAAKQARKAGARVQTTVHLTEHGGGLTNTGRAQIVAGLGGEPLRSFYGRATCGAAHAHFFVSAALVVNYSHHRGDGSGEVALVSVGPDHANIQREVLWRFRDGDQAVECMRPNTSLAFPQAAVEAARRKARIYHCRSAVYYEGTGATGPSGALTGAGAATGGLPSPLKGPGIGYDEA